MKDLLLGIAGILVTAAVLLLLFAPVFWLYMNVLEHINNQLAG